MDKGITTVVMKNDSCVFNSLSDSARGMEEVTFVYFKRRYYKLIRILIICYVRYKDFSALPAL